MFCVLLMNRNDSRRVLKWCMISLVRAVNFEPKRRHRKRREKNSNENIFLSDEPNPRLVCAHSYFPLLLFPPPVLPVCDGWSQPSREREKRTNRRSKRSNKIPERRRTIHDTHSRSQIEQEILRDVACAREDTEEHRQQQQRNNVNFLSYDQILQNSVRQLPLKQSQVPKNHSRNLKRKKNFRKKRVEIFFQIGNRKVRVWIE